MSITIAAARVDENFLSAAGATTTTASLTWTSGVLFLIPVFESHSPVAAVPTSVAGGTMTFTHIAAADVTASPSNNWRGSLWAALGDGSTSTVTITCAETPNDGAYGVYTYTPVGFSWSTASGAIKQAVVGNGTTTPAPSLTLAALQDANSVQMATIVVQPNSTMTPNLTTNYGGFGHTTPDSFAHNGGAQANTTAASWTGTVGAGWIGFTVEIAQAAGAVPAGGSIALTGTQKVASVLTATQSGWTNTPTSYTYTWQRADDAAFTTNVVTVRGPTTQAGTTDTYTLASTDDTKYIRCQGFATNGSGNSSTVNSSATAQITYPSPTNSVAPVASGTTQVGQTVSTTNGTWNPGP